MRMTRPMQSALVPSEDIELGAVETRPARLPASPRALRES
jgi:hypothetical protein